MQILKTLVEQGTGGSARCIEWGSHPIEVAYGSDQSSSLGDNDLWYVANGFMDFVGVGRCLPDMPARDLERVIDRGLDWLSSIGKSTWAAGLRLQRGTLWQQQGNKIAALDEMEAALALRQRYPTAPGYTLGGHLLKLADLLQELDRPSDAETYYQKVADSPEFVANEQGWAWKGLAQIAIGRADWLTAERCAQKSLDLARTIESPNDMVLAFDTLGDVYWQQSKLELAIAAKIQAWQYLRQYRKEDALYELSHDFAEIRLYQARQGQPQRYIPKAQQWLRWAMVWAVRLDRQFNSTVGASLGESPYRQTKIRALQAECLAVLNDVIDRASGL